MDNQKTVELIVHELDRDSDDNCSIHVGSGIGGTGSVEASMDGGSVVNRAKSKLKSLKSRFSKKGDDEDDDSRSVEKGKSTEDGDKKKKQKKKKAKDEVQSLSDSEPDSAKNVKVIVPSKSKKEKVKSTAVEQVSIETEYSRQYGDRRQSAQQKDLFSAKETVQRVPSLRSGPFAHPLALASDEPNRRPTTAAESRRDYLDDAEDAVDEDGVATVRMRNTTARKMRDDDVSNKKKTLELDLDADSDAADDGKSKKKKKHGKSKGDSDDESLGKEKKNKSKKSKSKSQAKDDSDDDQVQRKADKKNRKHTDAKDDSDADATPPARRKSLVGSLVDKRRKSKSKVVESEDAEVRNKL